MTVLADTGMPEVSKEFFWGFFAVITWLVLMADRLRGWFGKPKPQELAQPLEVVAKAEFVTQKEFKEFKEEHRREKQEMMQAMNARFDGLTDARRESIENLHNHITSLDERLTGMLKRVEDKIDDRLEAGNERMNAHAVDIAALKTVIHKGGKP